MVAAAETLEQQTDVFDWSFAESQFLQHPLVDIVPELPGYVRPPESETYGRSLSTIRRLGAFIIGKASSEIINSPDAAQAKAEFYTSVEEGFGTDMELGGGLEVRDFDMRPIMDGRVMSKDLKRSISAMTEAGLKCADETAKKDRRFLPQLTRSIWDHQNALIVDRMTRGETNYNTRIVISPFPEEAAAQSGNEYWRKVGYVPHLRRGFVQLYHATENGVITGSLSFDGSNKYHLREIFSQCGIEIPDGEITDNWLKYAITDTLSIKEAEALAIKIADTASHIKYQKNTNTVDVTKQYKPVMERVFNESYIHMCESLARGYQTEEARALILQLADQAHHFNDHYRTALYDMRANCEQFTNDDSIVLHELLVYSTIEMMRALHLQKTDLYHDPAQNDVRFAAEFLQAADIAVFQDMLSGFGADGAKNNRIYSACGLEINAGAGGDSASPQSAYGGQGESVKAEEASKKKLMSCPFCGAKVFDDPCARVLSCWDCRATVVNGRVVSKGDGGSKARAVRQVAEAKQREDAMAKQVDEVFKEAGVESFEVEKSKTEVSKQAGGQMIAKQVMAPAA